MLVVLTIVVIVVAIIMIGVFSSSDDTASGHTTIRDSSYKVDGAQKVDEEALACIRKCNRAIDEARSLSRTRVDLAFLKEQESIARESRRLEKELQQRISQRLHEAKFHELTQLHFDSMIEADRRYGYYKQACSALDSIGDTIVSVGKGNIRVSSSQKAQLYNAKDAIKATRDAHLYNVRLLNAQTHALKEKIRRECGKRGRSWAADRDRNAKHR